MVPLIKVGGSHLNLIRTHDGHPLWAASLKNLHHFLGHHHGACVYLRARQYSWSNYPLDYSGYTRTCSGGTRPFDFDVMYRMDLVELASENGASAVAWSR